MEKEISIIDFIKIKLKRKDNKKIVLTTDEIIKYNQLKVGLDLPWYSILTWPIYTVFYAGLFNLVLRYSFNISLTEPLLKIFSIFPRIWLLMLMAFIMVGILFEYTHSKFNKRLVLKIINERKK